MRAPAPALGVAELDLVPEAVKPKLLGRLHTGAFPVAVLLGAILVISAPTGRNRFCTAILAMTRHHALRRQCPLPPGTIEATGVPGRPSC